MKVLRRVPGMTQLSTAQLARRLLIAKLLDTAARCVDSAESFCLVSPLER